MQTESARRQFKPSKAARCSSCEGVAVLDASGQAKVCKECRRRAEHPERYEAGRGGPLDPEFDVP